MENGVDLFFRTTKIALPSLASIKMRSTADDPSISVMSRFPSTVMSRFPSNELAISPQAGGTLLPYVAIQPAPLALDFAQKVSRRTPNAR
jgi:hypothetical protein